MIPKMSTMSDKSRTQVILILGSKTLSGSARQSHILLVCLIFCCRNLSHKFGGEISKPFHLCSNNLFLEVALGTSLPDTFASKAAAQQAAELGNGGIHGLFVIQTLEGSAKLAQHRLSFPLFVRHG